MLFFLAEQVFLTMGRFEKWKCQSLRCVRLFVTPWTIAHQGPLSMGFSRQEYWSGLPFPPPGDLPNPGSKLSLLHCRHILYLGATREAPMGKSGPYLIQTQNAQWGGEVSKGQRRVFMFKFSLLAMKYDLFHTSLRFSKRHFVLFQVRCFVPTNLSFLLIP